MEDTDGYYSEPYEIFFSAGIHELALSSDLGDLAVAELTIGNAQSVPTYAELSAGYSRQGYTSAPVCSSHVQAELPQAKSSSMLYPLYDRSGPATEPSHYSRIRLNTIGGTNWGTNGQWIEWLMDVPESGLYEISFKARQNMMEGLNSYRTLSIDGEVPYAEAQEISFPYAVGWYLLTPQTEGENCQVYLTKGQHTLRLTVTAGPMAEVTRDLEKQTLALNTLYRRIIMITGVEPDKYRTYSIEKEIPDISATLQATVNKLTALSATVKEIAGSHGSQASIIDQVIASLNNLQKNVDRIPEQIDAFSDTVESLGTLLQTIRSQPLELDYILLSSQAEKPSVRSGFWQSLSYNTKAFFASFLEDYTSLTTTEDDKAISVWVSSGRDQAQVIKKMIDDQFVAQTGIPVNLSLVTSNLINAILAGQGPDVALMVDQSTPVNLAMRGALQDLSIFDSCSEVTGRFHPSAYAAFEYRDGLYALPNTQEYDMLFYRTDIFEELGLSVPQTWDELYSVVAILQKHNLTVGIPETNSANMGISSGIGIFNKFLLQNGGSYYNEQKTGTLFNTETAYTAFTTWTELYTEYGLDREFNFYNRFRNGEMPLSIQPFSMYNMLSQAAPEIRGLWGFTSVPGTLQADGTVNHADSPTVTGCVMLRDVQDPQSAWQLMDWWTSDTVQAQYGNELEAVMGTAARYATANVNAFAQLNWSDQELAILQKQRNNLKGIPEIPGSYFVNRCLTNAFRSVVSGNTNPVKALNTYNKDINTEIARKRKEFGLE